MKRNQLFILASPVIALCLLASIALAAFNFPQLTGRVTDQANIIFAPAKASIEAKLQNLEDKSSIQLVVATVSSLEGGDIESYANGLFRAWKLGEAKNNNGVLFLIAPKDHKVRIEVGYGLEGQLTDAKSRAIIDNYILPSFKRGDFNFGVLAGATEMVRALGGNPPEIGGPTTWFGEGHFAPPGSNKSLFNPPNGIALAVLVLFFLIPLIGTLLLVGALVSSPHKVQWDSNKGWDSDGGYSGGSSSGGGSSGGGGFSGGGGSFGGGGASGSW